MLAGFCVLSQAETQEDIYSWGMNLGFQTPEKKGSTS